MNKPNNIHLTKDDCKNIIDAFNEVLDQIDSFIQECVKEKDAKIKDLEAVNAIESALVKVFMAWMDIFNDKDLTLEEKIEDMREMSNLVTDFKKRLADTLTTTDTLRKGIRTP